MSGHQMAGLTDEADSRPLAWPCAGFPAELVLWETGVPAAMAFCFRLLAVMERIAPKMP